MTGQVPDATPGGADRVHEAGPVQLLRYTDAAFRVRHLCDRGERGIIWCAPLLGEAHEVDWPALAGPTVTPSILCSDCGLHGYLRDGVWSRA